MFFEEYLLNVITISVMKLLSVFKYIILLLCLSFVVYQSKECLVKFLDKPKGVELIVSSGVGHTFPHFTFCAEEGYNQTVFENCGLHYRNTTHGTTWVGDGPDYCKSPKLIMEKARINASELLKNVTIGYEDGTSKNIGTRDECCWKYTDHRTYGSCHTFFLPQGLRQKPMRILKFFMKANVNWLVHSEGTFVTMRKKKFIFSNTSDPSVDYDIDYKVFEMLDSLKEETCEADENYHRDDCYDSAAFRESMETLNCTWPLLRNKDHICIEQDKAKVAQKIGINYGKYWKGSNCASSCSFVKVSYSLLRETNLKPKEIRCMFPESFEVHKAYYAYDELSLIAEIGGYVGLFLGSSVYQITDLFDWLLDYWKRNQT